MFRYNADPAHLFPHIDLKKLNSMTKYPSIPTYHVMGERGRLSEQLSVDLTGKKVCATEKIDGTNARIIIWNDEFIIGSREELLYYCSDLLYNPSEGIVETISNIFSSSLLDLFKGKCLYVLYGEVYGGGLGRVNKNYSSSGLRSFRLFDVCYITFDDFSTMINWPLEKISSWRDHGGQSFVNLNLLHSYSALLNIQTVPLIGIFDSIPTTLEDTYNFMKQLLPKTLCSLDQDALMIPEGIVFRTYDRSVIAKARFDDYRKVLGR